MLAGRAWSFKLYPFTHREVSLNLKRALQFGTLPKIYLQKVSAKRTLKSYVETYIKEEIKQEAQLRNVEAFVRFLDVAAQYSGDIVNYSKIAKSASVADKTVFEYFSILVDTLIAFRLDGWHQSVRKQLIIAPRYYFFDNGVLNALRGELEMELKPSSFRFGRLFESFVIQEAMRLNDYCETDYRFNYWRTQSGQKVDLVLSRGNYSEIVAIEIKSSAAPTEKDCSGLMAFLVEHPDAQAICLSMTPRSYRIGPIQVVPWQLGLKKLF